MIVSLQNLANLREQFANKTIVLGTGTFDLFHYEHLRYLSDAKKLGDILFIAVKDNQCASLKGLNRPIIDERQRIAIVDSIKYVDYSFLVNYSTSMEILPFDNEYQKQWLKMFEKVFQTLKPDIFFYEINSTLQTARDRAFNKYEIKGVSRERTEIISTTKIINYIKNNF